ncbi:MAG: bacteriohemerythrin [Fusobacteria bacterium]|nr:bacteriohemerythrin [Fusobacteriota bacterium]
MKRSIKFKFFLVMLFLGLIILGNVFTVVLITNSKKYDGLLINLGGRQRMLTQRISKNIFTINSNYNVENAIDELNASIILYENTLKGMLEGGKTLDGANKEIVLKKSELKNNYTELTILWENYKKHIENFLNSNDSESLKYIYENNNLLLKLSNDMTLELQEISDYKEKILLNGQILFLLLSIILIVLVYIYLSKSIVLPITVFKELFHRASNGELDIRFPYEKRKDEIGELSNELDNFFYKINTILNNIESYSKALFNGSNELKHGLDEIRESIDFLKMSIGSAGSAIEEMSQTGQSISENAKYTEERFHAIINLTSQGETIVNNVIRSIGNIKNTVIIGKKSVSELADKTDMISEILMVINDIASQTNLLALNAAIEAARAGEFGKGFEVVAEEVRKLAVKTTESTKEIQDMIKNIQHDTKNVINNMEKTDNEVEKGVKIVAETGTAFSNIVSNINDASNLVSGVAHSATEQSYATDDISKETDSIVNSVEENVFIINRNFKEIDNIVEISKDLEELIKLFKAGSRDLDKIRHKEVKEVKQKDYIVWKTELDTGVEMIDTEHLGLIKEINNLIANIESGKGKEVVLDTIQFLADYTDEHFSHEEELMRRENYPDLEIQLKAHKYFVDNIKEIQHTLRTSGIQPGMTVKIKKIIADWLVNHIFHMDKKIGEFLKQKYRR